jgi:hypothetical protein
MTVEEYYKKNGWVCACNDDQYKKCLELVEQGILQPVKPEWFVDGKSDRFFVGSHVTSKETMPASLHKKVYPAPALEPGDFVNVTLYTSFDTPVDVTGVLEKFHVDKKGNEVAVVVVGFDTLVVKKNEVRKAKK